MSGQIAQCRFFHASDHTRTELGLNINLAIITGDMCGHKSQQDTPQIPTGRRPGKICGSNTAKPGNHGCKDDLNDNFGIAQNK